jgi:hypothetical protein
MDDALDRLIGPETARASEIRGSRVVLTRIMRTSMRTPKPCTPATCDGCGRTIVCGDWIHRRTAFPALEEPGRLLCSHCSYHGDRTYHCSTACYRRFQRAKKRIKARECQACGSRFQAIRKNATYCSNACRQWAHRNGDGLARQKPRSRGGAKSSVIFHRQTL